MMKILIILICIGSSEAYYSLIRDPSILHVLFGNISDMSDLRFPIKDQKIQVPDVKEKYEELGDHPPDLSQLFRPITDLKGPKVGNVTNDLVDFNAITTKMAGIKFGFQNASYVRRRMAEIDARRASGRRSKFDTEDWKWMENGKKTKIKKLAITLLIHTRFKVDMAVRQRINSRAYKAYKIGYMFNRLKHIQYNQAKLINAAKHHNWDVGKWGGYWGTAKSVKFHQLKFLIRMCEKVMRLDVDSRDLIDEINEVFNHTDPVTEHVPSSKSTEYDEED